MRKLTTKEFIERARNVHGGLYDYSKVVYVNARTKIIIIDSEYGEFFQRPHDHLNGIGCPKRGGTEKLTTEEFIERARNVHGDSYDYSKTVYERSHDKITIIDPEYGEFKQVAYYHLNGHGNPLRGTMKQSEQRRDSSEKFIKKSKLVHGELYDYSKVKYKNNHTKVIIIDKIHGEFEQTPSGHLNGNGCPYRNRNHLYEIDHIVPLSFICKGKERILNKERPLYKLFDSGKNKKLLPLKENKNKSDKILLNGKEIRGRNHRNDYKVIKKLLFEYNISSEKEIDNVIKQDKEYLTKNNI